MGWVVKATDGIGDGWKYLCEKGVWSADRADARIYEDRDMAVALRTRLKRTRYSVKLEEVK